MASARRKLPTSAPTGSRNSSQRSPNWPGGSSRVSARSCSWRRVYSAKTSAALGSVKCMPCPYTGRAGKANVTPGARPVDGMRWACSNEWGEEKPMLFKYTSPAVMALGIVAFSPGAAAREEPAPILAAQAPGSADERAASMVVLMTLDEKLTLLKGYFGTDFPAADYEAPADARYGSAGYVPGIPRLGIPPQWQADAGIGVATQGGAAEKRPRTALPSGLAVAASWDPEIARAGGAMIGAEARADGFNVLLAGSVNLMREPRNGRNFEYAGEDPLLAGT